MVVGPRLTRIGPTGPSERRNVYGLWTDEFWYDTKDPTNFIAPNQN